MGSHSIELNAQREGELAFSGMTVESIVIDRLNTFTGPKRDFDEKELYRKFQDTVITAGDTAALTAKIADLTTERDVLADTEKARADLATLQQQITDAQVALEAAKNPVEPIIP
jgi:hypothetical protein